MTPADRARAVAMVREQIAGGAKGPHAIRQVAQRRGCSPARLRCWLERVLEEEAGGVAAVEALADRPRSGRPPKVWDLTGAEVAWRLWRRYFLRLEAPPPRCAGSACGCSRTRGAGRSPRPRRSCAASGRRYPPRW